MLIVICLFHMFLLQYFGSVSWSTKTENNYLVITILAFVEECCEQCWLTCIRDTPVVLKPGTTPIRISRLQSVDHLLTMKRGLPSLYAKQGSFYVRGLLRDATLRYKNVRRTENVHESTKSWEPKVREQGAGPIKLK